MTNSQPQRTHAIAIRAFQMRELERIAASKNGRIAAGEDYVNAKTSMRFIDTAGNVFKMEPRHVKNGRWSPFESKNSNFGPAILDRLSAYAKSQGGELLPGQVYVDQKTPLRFKNASGKEFKATPLGVKKRANWHKGRRPYIMDKKDYFEKIKKIVRSKNGKIAPGQVYTDSKSKMQFIDASGNAFFKRAYQILVGEWSPYESGRSEDPEYHLAVLSRIANKRGGALAPDQKYVDSRTPLKFIDANGYVFWAKPTHLKEGNWSPYESGKTKDSKYQLELFSRIAKAFGGRLVEGQTYKNADTILHFIDADGRRFSRKAHIVKMGIWAPVKNRNANSKTKSGFQHLKRVRVIRRIRKQMHRENREKFKAHGSD